jgi:hypothetical protein
VSLITPTTLPISSAATRSRSKAAVVSRAFRDALSAMPAEWLELLATSASDDDSSSTAVETLRIASFTDSTSPRAASMSPLTMLAPRESSSTPRLAWLAADAALVRLCAARSLARSISCELSPSRAELLSIFAATGASASTSRPRFSTVPSPPPRSTRPAAERGVAEDLARAT